MSNWYKPDGPAYATTRSLTHLAPPQVVVPEGFRFNISSPKWAHWFVGPHDERFLKAACFHDYAILNLGWSRPKAAKLWWKLTPDVPLFKRIVTTLVLAIWPGK